MPMGKAEHHPGWKPLQGSAATRSQAGLQARAGLPAPRRERVLRYVRTVPTTTPSVRTVSEPCAPRGCMHEGVSQEHGGGFGYRTRSVGRFFFFHSFGVSASCGGARAGQRASRRRRRRCSSRSRRGVGAAAGVGERDRSRSSFRHSFIQSPRCLVGGRKQPGEGRVWSGSPRPRVACSPPVRNRGAGGTVPSVAR